jgi:tetratricopeptide (TPR) repeat protein
MGQVSLQHGQVNEAYEYYSQKLKIAQRLANSHPESEFFQRDLAVSHELVGNAAAYMNRPDEVLASYKKLNEIMQRLLDADPSNILRQRDLSISLVKLGNFCEDNSKLDLALDNYGRAAILLKNLADADPQNTKVQCELFVGFDNLSNVELARNEYAKAAGWLTKAREVLLPLHEKQKLVGQFQNAFADTEQKLLQCEQSIQANPKN